MNRYSKMLYRSSNIVLTVCCTVIGYVVAKGADDQLLALPSEVDPPHQVLTDSRARIDMSKKMHDTITDCCIFDGGSMVRTSDCDHTNSTAAAVKLSKLDIGKITILISR